MHYLITRGGQNYGPYTLADLQRYVASGHVLLTDLAKSEEMPEWVSVAQVLNPSGLPPASPTPPVSYAQPVSSAPAAQYPELPNLHWALVLLFDVLTLSLFRYVWNLVIAASVKRIQPNSQAIVYYIVGYVLMLLNGALSVPVYVGLVHHVVVPTHAGYSLIGFVGWILAIVARFNLKSSLEEHYNTVEPLGFRMSGVLTFLFGGLYIQSQINRINQTKEAIRYRDFGR